MLRLLSCATLAVLVAVGCDSPTDDGAMTTLAIVPAADTLAPGDTLYLIARLRDGAGNPMDADVSWSTDATTIELHGISAGDSIAELVAGEAGMAHMTAEADGAAAGAEAMVLQLTHHDPTPATSYYNDITGTGPEDIWVVGYDSVSILHFDGASWDTIDWFGDWVPAAGQAWAHLRGVWAPSPGEAWTVGRRWTDTGRVNVIVHVADGAFTEHFAPTTKGLRGIWGSGPSDIWAAGDSGVVLHYDGDTWTEVTPDYGAATPPSLRTPWGTGPDDVWVPAATGLLHYDGSSWTLHDSIDAMAVHGTGPGNVWAVGTHVHHFDGTSWSTVEVRTPQSRGLVDIWVASPEDIWAVGGQGIGSAGGYVIHYNGSSAWKNDPLDPASWRTVDLHTPYLFSNVWAPTSADVWITDANRPILQLHPPD